MSEPPNPVDPAGGEHEHLYTRKRDDTGGPLRVTPAGGTVVWTDDMLAAADRLHALEGELAVDARRLIAADALRDGLPLGDLIPLLGRLREDCAREAAALRAAAELYTRGEEVLLGAQSELAELLASVTGALLVRLVITSPGLLLMGALVGWLAIPDGPDGRLGTVRDLLLDHPELITSPEFVRFVQLTARSLDDGVSGAVGLVPPQPEPGDRGVAFGAVAVMGLGGMLGMFRETPVSVKRQSSWVDVGAPSGARERLDRVPEVDQVRIDTYRAPGLPPRYDVYVGPTETFSPYATDEPFDMTSNMAGVAGLSAGSFRAVEEAMQQAGIRPGDEVQLTGFSQGGLIATMVAASGDWNVVGLETYGAPAGNLPLPDGIAGIAVRNTDDLVPALAGPQLDHTLVQVEREAFAGDTPPPPGVAAPAHQRFSYEDTADAIDAAGSAVVRAELARLDSFGGDYLALEGATSTSTIFHADRIDTPTLDARPVTPAGTRGLSGGGSPTS